MGSLVCVILFIVYFTSCKTAFIGNNPILPITDSANRFSVSSTGGNLQLQILAKQKHFITISGDYHLKGSVSLPGSEYGWTSFYQSSGIYYGLTKKIGSHGNSVFVNLGGGFGSTYYFANYMEHDHTEPWYRIRFNSEFEIISGQTSFKIVTGKSSYFIPGIELNYVRFNSTGIDRTSSHNNSYPIKSTELFGNMEKLKNKNLLFPEVFITYMHNKNHFLFFTTIAAKASSLPDMSVSLRLGLGVNF